MIRIPNDKEFNIRVQMNKYEYQKGGKCHLGSKGSR